MVRAAASLYMVEAVIISFVKNEMKNGRIVTGVSLAIRFLYRAQNKKS